MDKNQLLDQFKQVFGVNGQRVYFSPGRINIIGEHTDYNGGNVFPCAISLGTYGVYVPRSDKQIRLYSENMKNDDIESFEIGDLKPETQAKSKWINYFKGMVVQLLQHGYQFDHGFDLLVYGNLPYGAGLSSSASIELLMGYILKHEFKLDVEQLDLVKFGQKVENDFIGLNSGIMDQFAVGMGKKKTMLFYLIRIQWNIIIIH